MTTNNDLDQARYWAEDVQRNYFPEQHKSVVAAARVIASLPDEWIDADKLREFIQDWREGIAKYPGRGDGRAEEILATLENDFLIPQPRTLADTGWDDNVHPYMEAVTISGRRHILLAPMGYTAVSENTILVAEHGGGVPVLVPAEALSPTGRYALLSLPDEEGGPEPAATIYAEKEMSE